MRITPLFALALVGCSPAPKPPVAKPPLPPAGADLAGDCPISASTSVAAAVSPHHPCRAWVEGTYGRVSSVGNGKSGAVWSVSSKKSAVFVTCQHCFSTPGGLRAPGGEDPVAQPIGPPPALAKDAVTSGPGDDRISRFRYAYALLAPRAPDSAADSKGNLTNIMPRDDWVVSAVSGKVYEVYGHLGMLPPQVLPPAPIAVHDPIGLLEVETTGAAVAGELALTLGFPNAAEGAMMFTVNKIHTDADAADIISRAEPGEREIPYDPNVEFLVAGQLTVGNSGGGVFDRRGRYLGVMVRGSVIPVDGAHFVRVVSATYIRDQLERALAEATPTLRDRVAPYLRSLPAHE